MTTADHRCDRCGALLAGYTPANPLLCSLCSKERDSYADRSRRAYERVRAEFPAGGEEARDAFWRYVNEDKKIAHRPPREDYVRTTREADGFTLEPAIEYRDGDDFHALVWKLTSIAINAGFTKHGDHMACARDCARCIEEEWPDRAYFVEVWQEGREGFAQVFQPFGVPRNR